MSLTRVRVEATAVTRDGVMDELIGAAALVRETYGGEWVEEEPGLEVQTSSKGFWGRLTIKRED